MEGADEDDLHDTGGTRVSDWKRASAGEVLHGTAQVLHGTQMCCTAHRCVAQTVQCSRLTGHHVDLLVAEVALWCVCKHVEVMAVCMTRITLSGEPADRAPPFDDQLLMAECDT